MDTQLHHAIEHLHRLLRERGIAGDVTLQLSSRGEYERLQRLLAPDAPAPAPMADIDAFLARSVVIGP